MNFELFVTQTIITVTVTVCGITNIFWVIEHKLNPYTYIVYQAAVCGLGRG